MYPPTMVPSCHEPTSAAAVQASTARMALAVTATCGDTDPDAIGRRCFFGWRRSASRSRTSLSRYVAEAAAQKIKNVSNVRERSLHVVSTPAAAGATKTSRFLLHCRGRRE